MLRSRTLSTQIIQVTRSLTRRTARALVLMLGVTATPLVAPSLATLSAQRATTAADAGRWLAALSDDSLQGRLTGSEGAQKAARMIADRMQRLGLEPLGDEGFLQRVPIFMAPPRQQGGSERLALGASFAALDTMPAERRRRAANVVGLLRGSDPALRDEYVILGAHYDHIGVSGADAVDGDSIFNGADDDASGVVAMLETARQLSEGRAPKRSVIFVAFIGEENGMTGTNWFIRNPPRPLAQVVADLQVEMIGRPDSVAGGPGKGWLTGFERSTMGELLSAAGVALIADPRPAQNFFMRSDNYPFALEGIPAHTVSTFGGHTDYHGVNDEVDRMDLDHVAAVINATAKAVRVLADGERVTWKDGGKPVRR